MQCFNPSKIFSFVIFTYLEMRGWRLASLALLTCAILHFSMLFSLLKTDNQKSSRHELVYRNKKVLDENEHVCLIFDSKRTQNAIGALKSLIFLTMKSNQTLPHLHLVTTRSQHAIIRSSLINIEDKIHFYDFDNCKSLVSVARAFSPHIHVAAHCKFYLHLILPTHVLSVLFVDNDIAFLQHPTLCMPRWKQREMIAMAPDMGDVCIREPERCWDTGYVAYVPDNLNCGNDNPPTNGTCPPPGKIVPYHFNGGVIFMNLERMRSADFRSMYEDHVWTAANKHGLRSAGWGEQCYINSFFSVYPDILHQLPCSCNYQFTAVRRRVLCPAKPIYIIHAWKYGLNTRDPYSLFIQHFTECSGHACFVNVPHVNGASAASKINATAYVPFPTAAVPSPTFKKPFFSLITRTADRPIMIQAAVSSLRNQVYQNFVHIIGVESDQNSNIAVASSTRTVVVQLNRSPPVDADEACRKCNSTPGRCLNAPPLSQPEKRATFLECFCKLSFPANAAFDILHKYVAQDSYVLYFDDDNLILESSTLLKLANVISMTPDAPNKLFIAASHLGRITPTSQSMNSRTMAQGDIDGSNLVFHSRHLSKTQWWSHRCGDWRTAKALNESLKAIWISQFLLMAANPFRDSVAGAQGGGMRQDGSKVSVIITSMANEGHRAAWLFRVISLLLSGPYLHVVGEVILIWNHPREDPPILPSKTKVYRMTKNSLNNRWTIGLEAAKYNKILNLDDDIEISLGAIMCMFHALRSRPRAIVGPYARFFETNGKYSMSELRDYNLPYRMILPRVLMAEKNTLMAYSNWPQLFPYVDNQEAHCDDVLLNMAVVHNKSEVLRLAFPAESIGDYWQSCMNEKGVKKGGMAGQRDRTQLRTDCIQEFLKHIPLPQIKNQVYKCSDYGLLESKSDTGYPAETYTTAIYLPECT